MEVIAQSKYVRISPKKISLIAAAIRSLPVAQAEKILIHLDKRAAKPLLLTLKQGVANATNNFSLIKESLVIKRLEVNKGPTYKRGRAASRGMWRPILKRTSHIKMVLEGEKEIEKKKGGKDGAKS